MIELDYVGINRREVVEIAGGGGYLRVRARIPWQELPHFVLLPGTLVMRWEHLDDDGLPVRLRSWRCRQSATEVDSVDLDLNLLLLDP